MNFCEEYGLLLLFLIKHLMTEATNKNLTQTLKYGLCSCVCSIQVPFCYVNIVNGLGHALSTTLVTLLALFSLHVPIVVVAVDVAVGVLAHMVAIVGGHHFCLIFKINDLNEREKTLKRDVIENCCFKYEFIICLV